MWNQMYSGGLTPKIIQANPKLLSLGDFSQDWQTHFQEVVNIKRSCVKNFQGLSLGLVPSLWRQQLKLTALRFHLLHALGWALPRGSGVDPWQCGYFKVWFQNKY